MTLTKLYTLTSNKLYKNNATIFINLIPIFLTKSNLLKINSIYLININNYHKLHLNDKIYKTNYKLQYFLILILI